MYIVAVPIYGGERTCIKRLYMDAEPTGRALLGRGSAYVRLLGLQFRIPAGAWMCVFCECCVLSEISVLG